MKSLFGDNRLANLLQLLYQTPGAAVSTLAWKLEVSERTVRNDIKQLNDLLRGCAAVEGAQGRYTLRVFDTERFQKVFAALSEADDFLNSPRNRMDYLFGRLMRSDRPLLTDELAYEMNVGRTTLMSDLKKLRAELEPYRLEILGKTSKGLMLRGQESDIRKYVLDQNYAQLYRDYPLDDEIGDAVAETLTHFEKSVQQSFSQFLTLMLDRFLNGHYIGALSASYYNLTARPEFAVVDELVDRIAAILRVELPVEEKLFVLLLIIGMRTPADVQNMQAIALDRSVRGLMDKVLRQIRAEMDIHMESGEFTDEFLYHLMFMINRLRFHVRLQNPMLGDLKEKYPLAWQMAGIAARVVAEDYGLTVTDDERGYLASYFGVFLEESGARQRRTFRVAVVCGTGRVTARLVAAQLKKVLDSSAELTLLADERATAELLDGFDIVLTTVELSCTCSRPVIRIHEIFNEQELLHKIEKARYWDQVDVPMLDNNWFVMTGLLDESRFFRLDGADSYDAAVAQMVHSLTRSGQVDTDFLERLRARERRGTMVFDHAVAIPHTVQEAGDRLVLAVGVCGEPIRHQGHEIRIIFLLGLPQQADGEDGLLIRVYDEIIRITQDNDLLGRITAADSFPALLRALYRQAGE
ncbi:MAG: PRD domain-containing protein [Butyricicoccus sp.]|nr:PRD domain-containing protein [Butyricicoccus sp.]